MFSKIKIDQKGFAGFTGELGGVQFIDGVSETPLPRVIIDRISAAVSCVIIDDDGNDGAQAGVATRLIGGVTIPATMEAPLKNMTPAELAEEHAAERKRSTRAPARVFYTETELNNLAAKGGITGLREIAAPWGVKDRSITKLIVEILAAQEEYKLRAKEIETEGRRVADEALKASLNKQATAEAELERHMRVLTPAAVQVPDMTPNAIGGDGEAPAHSSEKPNLIDPEDADEVVEEDEADFVDEDGETSTETSTETPPETDPAADKEPETQIADGVVTASTINVDQVSAITANVGDVTAGKLSGPATETE